MGGNCAKRVF